MSHHVKEPLRAQENDRWQAGARDGPAHRRNLHSFARAILDPRPNLSPAVVAPGIGIDTDGLLHHFLQCIFTTLKKKECLKKLIVKTTNLNFYIASRNYFGQR
jgi:hypothetical protein